MSLVRTFERYPPIVGLTPVDATRDDGHSGRARGGNALSTRTLGVMRRSGYRDDDKDG